MHCGLFPFPLPASSSGWAEEGARHGIRLYDSIGPDGTTLKGGIKLREVMRACVSVVGHRGQRADDEMPKQSSPKIRILIVDDHPVLREGLTLIIESQTDLQVVAEAGTGKEAIALFEENLPDVTLMDLGLPDIHGIDVIRRLRAQHPDARIIVLTTYLGDVQALRALQAGASGYLLKGTLRRDLLDTIRSVYQGQRQVQTEVASELAQHAADQSLTAREIEVLKLIAKGCSNKVVADRLHISEDTVKGHVGNILEKLKANDRTHAVTIALHRGYFEI
jgi:DNA-binding NarL/FixJ family response regulator